jgi:hypothetical protein
MRNVRVVVGVRQVDARRRTIMKASPVGLSSDRVVSGAAWRAIHGRADFASTI